MIISGIQPPLAGLTALVCGGSQGIGRAICQTFAAQGARIAAVARNGEALERLVADLPSPVGQPPHTSHRGIVCDLSRLSAWQGVISGALAEGLSVDILINNSGGPAAGPIESAEPDAFRAAIEQHLISASVLSQLVLPGMKERSFGRIINILSTSVKVPIPNLGVSNTIRAAVANWAKTLSMEVAPFGVTVNNVLPGYIETERLLSLAESTAQRQNTSRDAILEKWRAAVPAGRFGTPAELAHAVSFLAGPQSSYITGISLAVDGGRTGTH